MSDPTRDGSQSAQEYGERRQESLLFNIKAHLEDLFSDRHLAQDGFLLKHVQKNKRGYVSLKLLTCLKKIKALTTNWYTTLAAAELSDLLEVNEERTKVRRTEPLPKWLLCSPTSRLLLAWNVSKEQTGEDGEAVGLEQRSLSERIVRRFSARGGVISVWILHPGKELPKELRCYAKHHKEIGQHLCAVVKFDSLDAVREAHNVLKAEEEKSDGKGMCVVPLGFQSMHRLGKDESSEEKNEDRPEGILSQENPLETSDDWIQEEPSVPFTVSDRTPDTCRPQNTLNSSIQRTSEQIYTSCDGRPFSRLKERYSNMSWGSGDCDKESSRSPWVMRRKCAASALNPKAPGRPKALHLMQRVQRQPFGPDGTAGFQGRGRLLRQIKGGEDQTLAWTELYHLC